MGEERFERICHSCSVWSLNLSACELYQEEHDGGDSKPCEYFVELTDVQYISKELKE